MKIFWRFVLFLSIFVSPLAFADVDYYTYGGHESVVNAFYRLASVFNDPEFDYLVGAVAIAGVMVGYLITMGKSIIGGSVKLGDTVFALIATVFGVSLYYAAMGPTTTVHIYDETINRYEAVGNVPSLVANAVAIPNVLERGFTEIIDASTVYGRDRNANGKSMELLLNALTANPLADETYLNRSLYSFVNQCMPPGLASSLYTFNLNSFMSSTTELLAELEKLKSESVNVIYYDAANRGGIEQSCADTFDDIAALLTAEATYATHLDKICEKSGFDSTVALELLDCRGRIQNISQLVFGPGVHATDTKIFMDQAIAQASYELLSNYAGTAVREIANFREISQGYGNVIVAEGWIPAIRGATAVIILSITPILVIFMITPMIFRALHLLFTLFFFVGIWGVCDAIIHANIMDQVGELMNSITAYGGSITAFMMAPGEINKGLAVFGKMQSLGVMLAALFSAIFFKLSARPFAMAGERLADNIESVGNRTGEDVLDPSSKTNMMDRNVISEDKLDMMHKLTPGGYQPAIAGHSNQGIRDETAYLDSMATQSNITNPDDAWAFRAQTHGGDTAGHVGATIRNAGQQQQTVSGYAADQADTRTDLLQSGTEIDQQNIHRIAGDNSQSKSEATREYAGISKADQTGRVLTSTNSYDHIKTAETTSTQHMMDKKSFRQLAEDTGRTVGVKSLEEASTKHQMDYGEHQEKIAFQKANNIDGIEHGRRKARTEFEQSEAQLRGWEKMEEVGMAGSTQEAAYINELGQFMAFGAEHLNKVALSQITGTDIGQIYMDTSGPLSMKVSQDRAQAMVESINMEESKREALTQLQSQLEDIASGKTRELNLPGGDQLNQSWDTFSNAGLNDRVEGGLNGMPFSVAMGKEEALQLLALNNPDVQAFAAQNEKALSIIANSPEGGVFTTDVAMDDMGANASLTNTKATVERTTSVDDSDSIHSRLNTDKETAWTRLLSDDISNVIQFADLATENDQRMISTAQELTHGLLGHYRQQEQTQVRGTTELNASGNAELSKKSLSRMLKDDEKTDSTAINPGGGNTTQDDKGKGVGNKVGKALDAMPVDLGIVGQGIASKQWTDSSESEYSVDAAQTQLLEALREYSDNPDKQFAAQQLQATLNEIKSIDDELASKAVKKYDNEFVQETKDPGIIDEMLDSAKEYWDEIRR